MVSTELEDARDTLVKTVKEGAVTLVLGAGISFTRGVPLWDEVVHVLWGRVMGTPPPGHDPHLLQEVREVVRKELGDDIARRVSLRKHPLEPQLALELIEARLANPKTRMRVLQELDDRVAKRGVPASARRSRIPPPTNSDTRAAFVALLREAMYENASSENRNPDDALAIIGDMTRNEYDRWPKRRLVRIITFNADDLLEREVHRGRQPKERLQIVWSIVRASHHPFRGDVTKGRPPPIPIYHVHGFLPERVGGYMEAPDTLVFTDAQFWDCTANPMSFANRVMATALHDSNCVFVGLSMRDVNLMRWLGVRYNEVMEDKHEQHRHLGVPRDPAKAAARALDRHFWIHAENDDADGLVARMLVRRGVRSVRIPSWDSPDCGEIIRRCFG